MTRNIQIILIAAIVLIVFAVLFNSTFVASGSGLVLLVGLGYAYVVSKRDAERASTS